MKRLILTTTCALVLGVNAFADGLINFLNSSSTLVTLSSNGISLGSMPAVLGQFRFELFVAATGTTDPLQFVATGVQGTNQAFAGRFNGGFNRSVPGVEPGLNGAILVRGWSTSLGDDYSTALSLWKGGAGGFLGESEIRTPFLFGGDDGSGAIIPTSPLYGGPWGLQQGFALSTVPEPSALVLAGLGIASLIAFARRSRGASTTIKRLVPTILCALLLGTNAFGQGTFNFGNSSATLITLRDIWSGVNLGPIPAGMPGQFRFQLFLAPAGTVNPSLFVATSVIGTNLSAAGRLNGGNGVAVPGAPAGGTGAILLRGWSSNLGSDYATAYNNFWNLGQSGYIGQSVIAPNFLWGGDPGTGFIVPSSPAFGGSNGIQTGFELVGIPEPSALALSSLGFVSLAMLRRRNQSS